MRLGVITVAATAVLLAVGCGGEKTVRPTPAEVVGTIPQETVRVGDAEAGEAVFRQANPSCGGCHTFAAAGTRSTVGPDLDESLRGKDAAYIHESIVNPNAEIAQGFQPNVMPQNYEQTLSEKQLADLVAFLLEDRRT